MHTARVRAFALVVSLCAVTAHAQTTNLALNRPAVASSAASPTYAASMAVDGNGGTRWSSNFSDNEWWYVDLGATYTLSKIVINWEAAYAKTYDLQVSQDAVTWTTFFSGTNTFPANSEGTSTVTTSGTGRYVRFLGKTRAVVWGGQWGYSFWEFQAFGTLVGPPPAVTGLSPVDGATLAPLTQQLAWTPSPGATSYDVAFGITNPPPVVSASQAAATYSPGPLTYGTTYYWRVTSKNAGGSTTGNIARFTTLAQPVITTIKVTPTSATALVGTTQNFSASGTDQYGNAIAAAMAWTSSSPAFASINPSTGVATALAAGTTTITASSGGVSGAASFTVTSTPPVLTSITVTPQTSTVLAGGTIGFSAQGFDQRSAPFSATFTWTSSAPSVGTIDAATGAFTAVAGGTTTVTAKSGTVIGTATVNVTPRHNTTLNRLRVVSWNVAQGYSLLHQFDHQPQIDLIASMNPDIVVLNEMSLADNDMVSEYLAGMNSRTGKTWVGHFSPGIPGATAANSIGDMIMTWLPVDSQTTLPYCVIPGDTALPNDSSCVTFEHLGVTINSVPVDVASVHLNWFSNTNRVAQLQQLQAWMATYGPNQMLIGDFNAEPTDTAFWAPLKTSFQDVWASVVGTTGDLGITMDHRSVTNAPGRIDYHFIPLNTAHIGVQQFSVVKTVLSDHHLLFCDYVIQP